MDELGGCIIGGFVALSIAAHMIWLVVYLAHTAALLLSSLIEPI